MEIRRVNKKVRLESRLDAVKYQLITELVFLRRQSLIDTDLTCLALLALWGPIPLKEFCHKAVLHLYGSGIVTDVEKHPVRVQTVRNRLCIMEKRGFLTKEGRGKKMLSINPLIELVTTGNTLLEYNFLYLETKEEQGVNRGVSQRVGA